MFGAMSGRRLPPNDMESALSGRCGTVDGRALSGERCSLYSRVGGGKAADCAAAAGTAWAACGRGLGCASRTSSAACFLAALFA
jgi:hypothetical protein